MKMVKREQSRSVWLLGRQPGTPAPGVASGPYEIEWPAALTLRSAAGLSLPAVTIRGAVAEAYATSLKPVCRRRGRYRRFVGRETIRRDRCEARLALHDFELALAGVRELGRAVTHGGLPAPRTPEAEKALTMIGHSYRTLGHRNTTVMFRRAGVRGSERFARTRQLLRRRRRDPERDRIEIH